MKDKFELLDPVKYYKTYAACGNNYIRNIKTGENVGKAIRLQVWFTNEDGQPLTKPIFEEDCYEYVYVKHSENQ